MHCVTHFTITMTSCASPSDICLQHPSQCHSAESLAEDRMAPPKSSKSRNDCAVQGTNDSSIVSKCSTATLGYCRDDFLQYFVAKKQRRAPLINRGYHVRAAAMHYSVKGFLQAAGPDPKQLLVLGAGFDSSFFRLKHQGLLEGLTVFEIDFPPVMQRKRGLIEHHPELKSMLTGVQDSSESNCALWSDELRLVGVDLMQTKVLTSSLQAAGFDFEKKTLLVSEVVLAYMTHKGSCSVIQWASKMIPNAMFVLYEQINPNDGFGLFMQKHFTKIGSPLRTLNRYPGIQQQMQRFMDLGWDMVSAMDMNQFYHHFIDDTERQRVETLEPFDEYEEIHLKCNHYLLLWGFNGQCVDILEHLRPGPHVEFVDGKESKYLMSSYQRQVDDKKLSVLVSRRKCDSDNPESNDGAAVESAVISAEDGAAASNASDLSANDFSWTFHPPSAQCEMTGHAVAELPAGILCVGGFGNCGGSHTRRNHLILYDSKTSNTSVIPVDSNPKLVERVNHTATVLDERRVLLLGGRLSPMKPCSMSCLLQVIPSDTNMAGETSSDGMAEDTENGACSTASSGPCWRVTAEELCCQGDVPPPRWRHSATKCVLDGVVHVFVYGGRGVDCVYDDAYLLNTENWTWTKVLGSGEFPGCRLSHTANYYDRRIYVVGGLGPGHWPIDTIHVLDLQTRVWSKLHLQGTMLPRYSHTANVIGDRLVLLGGANTNHPSPGLAVVDLRTSAVQEYNIPDQDVSRLVMLHGHTTVAMDDQQLLVLGGGGNCFSFGTHFNSCPVMVSVPADAEKKEMV